MSECLRVAGALYEWPFLTSGPRINEGSKLNPIKIDFSKKMLPNSNIWKTRENYLHLVRDLLDD